eukprot:gene13241-15648_t
MQAIDNILYETNVQKGCSTLVALDDGNPCNARELASKYESGLSGYPKDLNSAAYYLLASSGTRSKRYLCVDGVEYDGLDTERNLKDALKWSLRDAENGLAAGQLFAARFYANGWGCKQDADEAEKLYQEALMPAGGYAGGGLRWDCDVEDPASENLEKAVMWCRLAATLGDPVGQMDPDQAFRYYQIAANDDFATAQCALASCYENGWGVDKSLEQAALWYSKAAEQGFVQAQFSMGI